MSWFAFSLREKRIYLDTYNNPSLRKVREGVQGKNPEEETEIENTEECCLLPASLWLAQLSFINSRGLPAWGYHIPQCRSSINQQSRNVPHTCPQSV